MRGDWPREEQGLSFFIAQWICVKVKAAMLLLCQGKFQWPSRRSLRKGMGLLESLIA